MDSPAAMVRCKRFCGFLASLFDAWCGEGAVGFFVEAGGDCFDGVGEEVVVIGNHNREAGFNSGELGEHGGLG